MKRVTFFTVVSAIVLALVFSACKHDLSNPSVTYLVTIDTGITHGTVSADKAVAQKNEIITLTISPNDCYVFESISVKDADNNDIVTTTVNVGTTYTFVMPESNVMVSVTFEQDMLIMVDVAGSSVTITGADPSFVDSEAYEWEKGVFTKGRDVTLSPFVMNKYQVTQGVYAKYMAGESINGQDLASEPSCCKENGTFPLISGEIQSKRPVEGVTWYDAMYFCNVLTEKTLGADKKVYTITNPSVDSRGHITSANVKLDRSKTGYRLPTAAEWEFAARGGDTTAADWNYMFSGHDKVSGSSYSDDKNSGMDSVGWYQYNSIDGTTGNETPSSGTPGYGTHEVGKKSPNRLGIYDMSGNVWEWCQDFKAFVVHGDLNGVPMTSTIYGIMAYGGSYSSKSRQCSVCAWTVSENKQGRADFGFRVVRSIIE